MARGSKPGERRGGRQAGTPNKLTQEISERLAAKGVDPIEGLADIATEAMTEAKAMEPGTAEKRDWLKLAQAANSELAQYVAPKRKAVEHSGSIATHEQSLEALADSEEDPGEC